MKKFFASALMFLLCFVILGTVNARVDAAVVGTDTITEGQVWTKSWSAQVEYMTLMLDVDNTGFYNLKINDYKQTGVFYLEVYDYSTKIYVGAVYNGKIVSNYTSSEMYFVKDHTYQVNCYYGSENEDYMLDAYMAVQFNRASVQLTDIPNCAIGSSNLNIRFTSANTTFWGKFKTSSSGDYGLKLSNIHAYVDVYKASTGEQVYSWLDTEYWNAYYESFFVKDELIIKLEANTEYYFKVRSYENDITSKLSMLKCAKNVSTIVADSLMFAIDSFSYINDINDENFYYKVIYTDGTSAKYDANTISRMGYERPYVEYAGNTVWIQSEEYFQAGYQPVKSTYNGQTTTIYIYIESISEWISHLTPVDAMSNCKISYQDSNEHTYYWRVKVSNSGMYGIWRYNSDDFGTNFEYYAIDILDDKNNVIEFDDDNDAWPLVANREYVLCFTYKYNPSYSYNEIVFWFQKSGELFTGWAFENNAWYYYENSEKVRNDWRQDSKGWCYLSGTGAMVTNGFVQDSVGLAYITADGYFYYNENGWRLVDGTWYFIENGYVVMDQWRQDSKGWCYLGKDGAMLTNVWLKDSIGWCWLDGSGYWNGIYYPTAAFTKNGWYFEGGAWYYYEADEIVRNEWRMDSKGWCFLSETGAMVTNNFVEDSFGSAYITADGYFYTTENGWRLVGNQWYFVENGYAVKDQWRQDSIGWCYLGTDGAMLTNVWLKDSVGWCWLDASGYWDGIYYYSIPV